MSYDCNEPKENKLLSAFVPTKQFKQSFMISLIRLESRRNAFVLCLQLICSFLFCIVHKIQIQIQIVFRNVQT